MLCAVGYVIRQVDGRYKRQMCTISNKADVDILPNIQKTAESQLDVHLMTEADEIGAGFPAKAKR